MSVVAFLVVGRDGSSTFNGSSAGITSTLDREAFLAARRSFDCILIGGQSARTEPYARTPVPLIVVSRSRPLVLDRNPRARWWTCSPTKAVKRAIKSFGPDICVEGGVNFIRELLEGGLIEEFRLSVTSAHGGENKISVSELLNNFANVTKNEIGETTFYVATSPVVASATKQK